MMTGLFIVLGLFAAPFFLYVLLLMWLAFRSWWIRGRYGVCRKCGCTDQDCFDCIMATGEPCWWIDESHTLCSRCVDELAPADVEDAVSPDCSPLNRRSSHKGHKGARR